MRFECPGCDTILTRDAALKHTKHGGICNTMYPIRHETKSADDHDIRDRVKKIEDESNQDKDANEEQIKKQEEEEETKKANMKLSGKELDEILESLRADIEKIKKNLTEDDDKTEDEEKQSISSKEH